MDAYDIEIIQGSTFSLSLGLTDSESNPIDLTDYNVNAYIRYRFSDSSKLSDLNPTKTLPYTSGLIALTIPATGTAVLPVTIARYDVEIMNTGTLVVDKVLMGEVTISPEVTK
jgi:hypothetical protein